MPQLNRLSINLNTVNVVIPVTADDAFRRVAGAPDEDAVWDLVELRLDLLEIEAGQTSQPLLLTPRHPDEGGGASCAEAAERAARVEPWIPFAAALDIEVAHHESMASTVAAARDAGLAVVLSSHDFEGTPPTGELSETVLRAIDAGADIIKIATRTETPGDVARLLQLLEQFPEHRLAVMGMGSLGMASRLIAARCGSVLNYASFGEANVEGQWPLAEFCALLDRLGAR